MNMKRIFGLALFLFSAATCAAELAMEVGAETIDVEAVLEAITRLGLEAKESADDAIVLKHPGRVSKKPKQRMARKKSA